MRLAVFRRIVGYQLGAATDWIGAAAAMLERRSLAAATLNVDSAEIERAIGAGCAFLARRQRTGGAFVGFQLSPGASAEWLTAHVIFVCEDVPELRPTLRRAALHLASTGPEDGGWGYNRRVGPDYDSTAQALMALCAHGIEPAPFLVNWLLAGQQPDGGCPTYPRSDAGGHGWQDEHPDTTLMTALCFARLGHRAAADRAYSWVERQALPEGTPAYWWEGFGYTDWLAGRTGGRISPGRGFGAAATSGAPQLCWTIGLSVAAADAGFELMVRRLLSIQLDDGSWPCAPCLRVTDRRQRTAAPFAPGRLFADVRRVFSTAHAVAALHLVRAHHRFSSSTSAT